MKANRFLIVVACAGLFGSCAATAPKELVDARAAYRRASAGPAAEVAPAKLHVANQALAQAESAFQESPDSYQTRDLAYVAERKAQLAEAAASISNQKESQAQSKDDYEATQGRIVTKTKQDLSNSRKALAASEQTGEMTAERLSAEKTARSDAERRAADALAKLGAVKEEPRGMVITLSGSVLFASNQKTLLPQARTRLDQVAEVLLTTRERNITIEGHTDSQGTDSHNQDLSQGRADAVRDYLVQRGYQADRIKSHGLGEGQPVSDNANAEGRANNRRVEIIIDRELHASNQ